MNVTGITEFILCKTESCFVPVVAPKDLQALLNPSASGAKIPPCSWTARVRALMPNSSHQGALLQELVPSNLGSPHCSAQVTAQAIKFLMKVG